MRNISPKCCAFTEILRTFANVNGKHCKGNAKMNANKWQNYVIFVKPNAIPTIL